MTYNEIIYMCLDLLKLSSNDAFYTQDHILFLVDKARAILLKQRYGDIKREVPTSNYQEIEFQLEEVPPITGEPCEGGYYLRTTEKLPSLLQIGNTRVFPLDYYQGEITYVTKDRMRYVNFNKWLKNIIYCSKAPNDYMYFKSCNPQFLYLEKVRVNGVFEDTVEAEKLKNKNNDDTPCDFLDNEYPIEAGLVYQLIQLVMQMMGVTYNPEDTVNNADDDLSKVQQKK